jgi:hypothetical protein
MLIPQPTKTPPKMLSELYYGKTTFVRLVLSWGITPVLGMLALAPVLHFGTGATARTTSRRWGRWTIVMCRLLIGSFKFKFNCLNMNLIVLTEN